METALKFINQYIALQSAKNTEVICDAKKQ